MNLATSRPGRRLLPASALLLFAASGSPAAAQSLIHRFVGDDPGDLLGYTSSPAGDVDGDGHADVIVGVKGDDDNGIDSGSARVHSGRDGSLLYRFDGDAAGDVVGGHFSLGGDGDVNGDGHADLLVGAYGSDVNGTDSGLVRVYSGADGALLYQIDGEAAGDWFGFAAQFVGDLDGDQRDDFAVSAFYDDTGAANAGSVRIFSGADGSQIRRHDGDSADDGFGASFGYGGDVDGDGVHDLAVVAIYDDNTGFDTGNVKVFSGADGSVLYSFDGVSSQLPLRSCAFVGDVDGDGREDVSLSYGSISSGIVGHVDVLSGVDASVIHTFTGAGLGGSIFGGHRLGDIDGDGVVDLWCGFWDAGSNGFGSGSVRGYSGADASVLFTIHGIATGDRFAQGAGVGDVDGDGWPDLMVTARFAGSMPLPPFGFIEGPGETYVFSCRPEPDCNGNGLSDALDIELYGSANDFDENGVPDECETVGTTYCSPNTANSTGVPASIEAWGSAVASEGRLFLRADSLPNFTFGYFLTSQQQDQVLFPGGSLGVLCLGGSIGRFITQVQNSGDTGTIAIDVDTSAMPLSPNAVVQAGETWNFQLWYRDVQFVPVSNFSDSTSVTFQ